MKKIQALLPLLPLVLFTVTVRGQAPAASPTPDVAPSASTAPAAIDPAKRLEIEKLLELTGTAKLMNQVLDQMVSSFKMHNTGVSDEFWDRFEKEMNTQDLINKMMPIYDKYYSLDDLKAVNAFYQTPAGQRMLAATPKIMQESMQMGQAWGRGVGMKLETELQEEKAKAGANGTAGSSATPAPAGP
jgi:hypothetical protein